MKNAVIYARYSCDNQTEQSIEGQLRVCNEYAKNNNIKVLNTYIDRAMTGTNDNRPDFQKMIKDSSKKLWDYVLVYKLDRFSRNIYETTIHKHTLLTNGTKLVSATENIPETPEGIILESMLEGMNQYYSTELSQKVIRGINESYIKGQYTGGPQLYGYDVIDKKNIPNKEESQIVREIFTKFAKGLTGKAIAKRLKRRGIKTKKGHYLNNKIICKIICNPKYIGKTIHNGKEYLNIYPPIIDEDTWLSVQSVRDSYKDANCRKGILNGYLLSNKLYCGYCKHKITGSSSKVINHIIKYRYYNCLTKRNRKKESCELRTIKKEYLEKLVLDTIYNFLSNENYLKIIANSILENNKKVNNDHQTALNLLETKKATLKMESDNLINAIEKGKTTMRTNSKLIKIQKEINKVDQDLNKEKQKTFTFLTYDLIINYFKNIVFDDINNKDIQKRLIKTFIREIVVYNEKIIILCNFIDPLKTKNSSRDNIKNINFDSIELKSFSDKDINIKDNLSYFVSDKYFAIKQIRE